MDDTNEKVTLQRDGQSIRIHIFHSAEASAKASR
jgi:hypothetical protein